MRPPIVAIDGPAGAGKSSAAKGLAAHLGFVLIDTGALYRAVALAADERGVSWDDGPALGRLAAGLSLSFAPAVGEGRPALFVDEVDRSADLRTPSMSQGASRVSAHREVRAALLGVQRAMGERGGVVLEGRDIGTVVFPDAEVKVFLTASAEARAERRHAELPAGSDLATVLSEIEERDARDSNRATAPLRAATDAVHLDTTGLSLEAVVEELARIVREAIDEATASRAPR